MPRASTDSDVFNAVAEPQRRAILDLLADGELPVGALVDELELAQPSVSKHLRVLKEVGLVTPRRDGRSIVYRLNGAALRPIHEWTQSFERLWSRQLQRVKQRAESKKRTPTR